MHGENGLDGTRRGSCDDLEPRRRQPPPIPSLGRHLHDALPQAEAAITAYGVHAVIANELHSRKQRVTVVTPGATNGGFECRQITLAPGQAEPIERDLVAGIIELHASRLARAGT